MLRDIHSRLSSEGGFGLITVLLAVLVLGFLAAAVLANTMGQIQATGEGRDHENAIHAAEAAVHVVAAEAEADATHVTTTEDGVAHEITSDDTTTEAVERAWAVAIAEDPAACTLVATAAGEACGIRPIDADTGETASVIYGVGFVPTRAAPNKIRVARVDLASGRLAPDYAILVGDDLELADDPVVRNEGDVHVNGVLEVGGNPDIDGELTYSGGFSSGSSFADVEQVPEVDVPTVSARSFYREAPRYVSHTNGGVYNGSWFDLCGDGMVRAPATDGGDPCTGELISGGGGQRGWELVGDTWEFSGNQSQTDGIYYVHGKNAEISGNPGTPGNPTAMTVISEAVEVCGSDGSLSGTVEVSATADPYLQPFLPSLLFAADRDLQIDLVDPDGQLSGIMLAHEQFAISGNPTMTGAIIGEDGCDTGNSPVGSSAIVSGAVNGHMNLTYDPTMDLPHGGLRITTWNEL